MYRAGCLMTRQEEALLKELVQVAQILDRHEATMMSNGTTVAVGDVDPRTQPFFDSNMNVVTQPTGTKPGSGNAAVVASTPSTDERFVTNLMVKSSAHVSYIVGKQGSKIRQIRNATGTVIQTPVNGEVPLFKIRGPKEKVMQAKAMLEEAAKEFDKAIYLEACSFRDGDRIRNNVFLPARFIGLVVGTRGSIIKRIMELSGTAIVTPKVNTLNGFKIDGTPDQIRHAIDLIKDHIMKTTSHVEIKEVRDNQYETTLLINDH